MENKFYLCGEKIKQNSSLVELLKECENDFEVLATFDEVPIKYYDRVKEYCLNSHVPMTIYEHYIGIPLRPKSSSSSGKPENPEYSPYVDYFVAPMSGAIGIQDGGPFDLIHGGWALYEVMWREKNGKKN